MFYILNTTDWNHTFILKKMWVIDGQPFIPKQTCTFTSRLFALPVTVLWVLKQLISSAVCDCRAIIAMVICEVSC